MFWQDFWPTLERGGWKYVPATAAALEVFAVPGNPSDCASPAEEKIGDRDDDSADGALPARPRALLRSVLEVIQFVFVHGLGAHVWLA